MEKTIPYKIYLEESEMPTAWYNLRADMINKPAPLLNPETLEPMTAEDLKPIFCEELIEQELDDTTPYFDIPEEIENVNVVYGISAGIGRSAYALEPFLAKIGLYE